MEDRNERAVRTDQYHESLQVGDRIESDNHVAWQDDIIELALKNDSPFHAVLGIDELRFLNPVRPGDTNTLRSVTVAMQVARRRRKGDRGVVKHDAIVCNQHDERVLTATFIVLVKRKRAG